VLRVYLALRCVNRRQLGMRCQEHLKISRKPQFAKLPHACRISADRFWPKFGQWKRRSSHTIGSGRAWGTCQVADWHGSLAASAARATCKAHLFRVSLFKLMRRNGCTYCRRRSPEGILEKKRN
jgi:hypothetical protein